IADNPAKDFIAARRAGLDSIYVRRETGVYYDTNAVSAEHEADFTIGGLLELCEILEGWDEGMLRQ
ncbi:MAG TPA: hypothetical protein VFB34_09890, partial [Chloroflexota bacterium]|nr:hypothetical protein [Chloroflexota bacterium]